VVKIKEEQEEDNRKVCLVFLENCLISARALFREKSLFILIQGSHHPLQ